jgi:hypothetical protein
VTRRRFWDLTGWFWLTVLPMLAICGLVWLMTATPSVDDECPAGVVFVVVETPT